MASLEIAFKGGAVITAEVSDWTFKNSMGVKSLEWTTPARRKRRLVHVDMDEVAAIVEVT